MATYVCDLCGFQSEDRAALMTHFADKHPESDPENVATIIQDGQYLTLTDGLLTAVDFDTLTLTTAHAASSYGVPVLVIEGAAYGPADMTPAGVTGAELVTAWAARFAGQGQADRAPDGAAILSQVAGLTQPDRALLLGILGRLIEVEAAERADWQDPEANPYLLSGAELDRATGRAARG